MIYVVFLSRLALEGTIRPTSMELSCGTGVPHGTPDFAWDAQWFSGAWIKHKHKPWIWFSVYGMVYDPHGGIFHEINQP